jgi:hypothetical protein
MNILDRIRSPVVVRKTVAFGMSVGEITQALHYAMPSTALHGHTGSGTKVCALDFHSI